MNSLRPQELAAWIEAGRPHRLIDVRERHEWNLLRLTGAEWKPLSSLGLWFEELVEQPGEVPLVVCCHHGIRSARVCGLLEQAGVKNCWNLSGGLEAWTDEVDPTLPRY